MATLGHCPIHGPIDDVLELELRDGSVFHRPKVGIGCGKKIELVGVDPRKFDLPGIMERAPTIEVVEPSAATAAKPLTARWLKRTHANRTWILLPSGRKVSARAREVEAVLAEHNQLAWLFEQALVILDSFNQYPGVRKYLDYARSRTGLDHVEDSRGEDDANDRK